MVDQNVHISGRTQEFVASLVEAGVHKDADAVVKDALDRYEHEYATKLDALREAAREGFADFETGDYVTVASAEDHKALWDEIHSEVDARRAARQAKAS